MHPIQFASLSKALPSVHDTNTLPPFPSLQVHVSTSNSAFFMINSVEIPVELRYSPPPYPFDAVHDLNEVFEALASPLTYSGLK